MLLLGIDLGTSSVKVSVVESESRQCMASATFPDSEAEILSFYTGWAEQSPEVWWSYVKKAILRLHAQNKYQPKNIGAIGISYQMHGLVLVDKDQKVLRNSIIWCDSRAVEIGNKAFHDIGPVKCLEHLLGSPGNFTASKLFWVKQNEPKIFEKIDKMMLPGDFIAMKLSGSITTSISALSEGMFWDFKENELSRDVFNYFGFSTQLIPEIKPVFSVHGQLSLAVASALSLKPGIPISYKSGDQPNNALSLNVLEPGQVAATAGTSGVIYSITDRLVYDAQSRVNTFAHVNYSEKKKRMGVLLCINGTGILNRWIRDLAGEGRIYSEINDLAETVQNGSEGLRVLPFGNGAERMLNNRRLNAQIHHLDFNKHHREHIFRASQEGIAFSFRYGLDIMRENSMNPQIIRASRTNLFLSDVFAQFFCNINQVGIEFYDGDGSYGAALGAGIGARIYRDPQEAFQGRESLKIMEPDQKSLYEDLYQDWKNILIHQLSIEEEKGMDLKTN
jgi:xylulokinase